MWNYCDTKQPLIPSGVHFTVVSPLQSAIWWSCNFELEKWLQNTRDIRAYAIVLQSSVNLYFWTVASDRYWKHRWKKKQLFVDYTTTNKNINNSYRSAVILWIQIHLNFNKTDLNSFVMQKPKRKALNHCLYINHSDLQMERWSSWYVSCRDTTAWLCFEYWF